MKKLLLILALIHTSFALQSMNKKTYANIEKANAFMEKKQYAKAQNVFKGLLENTSKKRTYDFAFIYNAKAYLDIQRNNFLLAIEDYEHALAYKVLPESMANNIVYTLAQLLLQGGNYTKSLDYLQQWHRIKKPTLGSSKLMMVNYLSLSKTAKALTWCEKAILLSKKPSKPLYQNKLGLELKLKKRLAAIDTLKFMIQHFKPEKSYFTQLSYLYQQEGYDEKSVGILESAYQLKLLTRYEEKVQLAQMLNYTQATQKAIEVLTPLLNDKKHRKQTLTMLYSMQLVAQETKAAIGTLEQLYTLEKTDKTAFLLAQLHASLAQWKSCEHYAKTVDTNEAKMVLAIALVEQEKRVKATKILAFLSKQKGFKQQALMWLEHIKP